MTTPLNPLDREAWEKRLEAHELNAHAATLRVPTYLHDRYVKEALASRKSIITDILALQSQLTEAQAEIERLRGC